MSDQKQEQVLYLAIAEMFACKGKKIDPEVCVIWTKHLFSFGSEAVDALKAEAKSAEPFPTVGSVIARIEKQNESKKAAALERIMRINDKIRSSEVRRDKQGELFFDVKFLPEEAELQLEWEKFGRPKQFLSLSEDDCMALASRGNA